MIQYRYAPNIGGDSDIPDRWDDLPRHDIAVFQSENIQNILDARLDQTKPVKVTYNIRKVNEERKDQIYKTLSDYFEALKESFKKSGSQDIADQKEKVELALNNPDKWYSLEIKEENTTGLIGDELGKEKGSKYYALIRHTNKSEKDDISGGTFGKGSSVYTYSSGLWLWFAYSVLSKAEGDTKKRFVGRGMIVPFVDYDKVISYLGSIWYARKDEEKSSSKEGEHLGLPFRNENADKQAKLFGLSIRDINDPGTTYLIPVFWPDGLTVDNISETEIVSQLRHEIIKRWYVSIYNENLECVIKTSGLEDIIIDKKSLYSISEINYECEILDYYNNKISNDKLFKTSEVKISLPKLKKEQQSLLKEKLGKQNIATEQSDAYAELVIRELTSQEADNFKGYSDIDTKKAVNLNRVALVRNKGMVVNYYPYMSRSKGSLKKLIGDKNFVGILFCGRQSKIKQSTNIIDHFELFLSYAENPAHNEWINNQSDVKRCNLNRFEETPYPLPANRVDRFFGNLEKAVELLFPKDDEPTIDEDICDFWKKITNMPQSGDAKSGKINMSCRIINSGFNIKGKYFWEIELESKLSDKELIVKFIPTLKSKEKNIRKPDDFKLIGIESFVNKLTVRDGDNYYKDIKLQPNEIKSLYVETCDMVSDDVYKNLKPTLEIKDEIIEE